MRQLARFNKIISFLNLLAIALLLTACFVPFIHSESFSFLSFLGLGVPALVATNILFMLYWALQRKRKLFGSLIALLIGYFSLVSFYTWNFTEEKTVGDLKVMTYNVRYFNKYKVIRSETVLRDIKAFIKKEDPDIICLQEPHSGSRDEFKDYPYRYLEYIHMERKELLAIFSKYPILETGLLHLPRTTRKAVFTDIQYKKDTIRIYNVHLESLGITPGQRVLTKEPIDKIFHKVSRAFQKQIEQAKVVEQHLRTSPYKTILCGDFNNGQYSNVYSTIKGNFQDTFLKAGTGYDRTYIFHSLPFRIDFIFADQSFEVKSHVSYDVEYSYHFPVMASFDLGGD